MCAALFFALRFLTPPALVQIVNMSQEPYPGFFGNPPHSFCSVPVPVAHTNCLGKSSLQAGPTRGMVHVKSITESHSQGGLYQAVPALWHVATSLLFAES